MKIPATMRGADRDERGEGFEKDGSDDEREPDGSSEESTWREDA